MFLKRISKNISHFFGWAGLGFCSLLVRFVPAGSLYRFADYLSALGYRFAAKQRNIALESLDIAFGAAKDRNERENIARDCFRQMAKSAIELLFLIDKPGLLKQRVSLEGKGNLEQALGRGRGVILVSAHFGNFPLLLARLSQEGYKVSGIMRPMRDEKVERIFLEKRKKYGVKTIYSQPRDACVSEAIDTLRKNEVLFIPIDQNFGTAGVFVDFFGRKAATATGPVIFAQRTKAALVPCFIVRQNDDTHKIIFEPEVALEAGPDVRQSLLFNIQKLTNIIELYIRRFPAQWGWIHRRWKSRPN